MTDPRQEFVEAMRDIIGVTMNEPVCVAACRSACIAFADALYPDITSGGPIPAPLSGAKLRAKERAALLREVGLSE